MKSMLSNRKSQQVWDVVLFCIAECLPQQVETILTGDVVNSFFNKDHLFQHTERMHILKSMLTVPGVDFERVLPCLETLLEIASTPSDPFTVSGNIMIAITGASNIALRFRESVRYFINNPPKLQRIVELMHNKDFDFCNHVLYLLLELARLTEDMKAEFKQALLDQTNILGEISLVLDDKNNPLLVNSALRLLTELIFLDIMTGVRVFSHGQLLQQVKSYIGRDDLAIVTFMGILEQLDTQPQYVETVLEHGIIAALCYGLNFPVHEDLPSLLEILELALNAGELLVDGEKVLFNPVALHIAEIDALDAFKKLDEGGKLTQKFFGEKYEEYLARRRGLKTKKANA